MTKPMIMAHGGAWDWDDALDAGKLQGLEAAIAAGRQVLTQGGTALDAVEQTVLALEDDPVFDAGTGGYLNQEGEVQLDALIIDGAAHDFGAVAGVRKVKNPISLARRIMEETGQAFFVGSDADNLARAMAIGWIDNRDLVTPQMLQFYNDRRKDGPHDTVGAIALDSNGNFAVATSTSGTPYKPAGRVGDTPVYGAGGYCENGLGAAGATGKGEHIMRTLLSKFLCDRLAQGQNARVAAKDAANFFKSRFPQSMAGIIAIDASGMPAGAQAAPKMAHGWLGEDGRILTSVRSQIAD